MAQARLAHQRLVVVRFLGGQIEDEQAIHARAGGIGDEPLHADLVDEVEVNVEDNGRLGFAPDGGDGVVGGPAADQQDDG